MIDKDTLKEIWKLHYLDNLSFRQISLKLGLHRNTVTKYVRSTEANLHQLKLQLLSENKCSDSNFHSYISNHWEELINEIISFTHVRKKRVLTDDIVSKIYQISEELDSYSAIEVFEFIKANNVDFRLKALSYSSIWRVLDDLYENSQS